MHSQARRSQSAKVSVLLDTPAVDLVDENACPVVKMLVLDSHKILSCAMDLTANRNNCEVHPTGRQLQFPNQENVNAITMEPLQQSSNMIQNLTADLMVQTSSLLVQEDNHHVPMWNSPATMIAYNSICMIDKGAYYVFNRPFVLPTSLRLSTPRECSTYFATSRAVDVFNYGIASHQYGKQYGKSAALYQAKEIYHKTLRIIQRCGVQRNFGKLLECLALNNLASIHSEMSDFQNAKMCLECMQDVLANDSYIHVFASEYIDYVEWFNIQLNIEFSGCFLTAPVA